MTVNDEDADNACAVEVSFRCIKSQPSDPEPRVIRSNTHPPLSATQQRPQKAFLTPIQHLSHAEGRRRPLVAHGPGRLELLLHGGLREDGVPGQAADPTSAAPDGAQLHGRDAAAVAADTARVAAAVVRVDELAGRREVQARKGGGFAEGVAVEKMC